MLFLYYKDNLLFGNLKINTKYWNGSIYNILSPLANRSMSALKTTLVVSLLVMATFCHLTQEPSELNGQIYKPFTEE